MYPSLTMAQVMQRFLSEYKSTHPLSPDQSKVIGSICHCRTQSLGGSLLSCDHCHYQMSQYHSCRNRHCPQCQYRASQQWREQQREQLLPVPYFHLVFTLPHALNGWAQIHPEVIYRLLFKAAWQSLQKFSQHSKQLQGGQLGMTAVMHTWGQNLNQHIHLHCLIPAGALSVDGKHWCSCANYLFPVRALSRCFRGKMVSLLRQSWNAQALHRIKSAQEVSQLLTLLMKKDWVVYAKSTCQHSGSVVDYLSQYTYRIAISNRRLVSMDKKTVRFRWKDYAEKGIQKVMSLSGSEFMRRFLLHVLPSGFMRIRHYGFLANCHRKRKLIQIRQCLDVPHTSEEGVSVRADSSVSSAALLGTKLRPCPRCEIGCLQLIAELSARALTTNAGFI